MTSRVHSTILRRSLPSGIVGLLLLIVATVSAQAQGTAPGNALGLRLDGNPIRIDINQPRQVRWIRLDITPGMQITHGTLETSGSADSYLTLYRDLEDAVADRPLSQDDDSGAGTNALISQALGYPSPLYAQARLYSSSRTGSFQLGFRSSFEEPQACPSDVCFIESATKSEPEAKPFLATLRGIRDTLLLETTAGKEVADLYYDLSLDLLWEAAVDGDFRRSVVSSLQALKPVLVELQAIGTSEARGLRLSTEHLQLASDLYESLMERASPGNAARLSALFSALELEERIGQTYGQLLRETGYLDAEPSRWVRIPGSTQLALRDEVLVKLQPSAAASLEVVAGSMRSTDPELDRVIQSLGVSASLAVFPDHVSRSPLGRVFKWRLAPEADLEGTLAQLRELDSLEYAEPNGRMILHSQDPYFRYQYGLENSTHPAADVRATEAWNLERGRRSVLVAVVDSGVDARHADLAGRVRADLGFNFVDDNANSDDDHGHGTHVSGIVAAAADNRIAGAGVAPGVEILPVKVVDASGSGSWEGIARGIVHSVDRGAVIINMSLGGDDSTQVVEDALAYAESRGVLVFASAGNDGRDQISFPARSPRALSVAATDNQNRLASFSNFGPGLDLSAPGVNVVSTQLAGLSCSWSGTSMSAPHASGVAALLLSRYPTLTLAQKKRILRTSTLDLGARGYDSQFGWGLADAYAALTSSEVPRPEPCVQDSDTHCLNGGRFAVELDWNNQSGATGKGRRVTVASAEDSGLFWFFGPDNWEMLVKVLDGCGANDRFWVFSAATTNVGYTLRVTDTQTGAERRYSNPLGRAAPTLIDTNAFATCGSSGASSTVPVPEAIAEPSINLESEGAEALALGPELTPLFDEACSGPGLCLSDRFQVDVSWVDQRGRTGRGTAVPAGSQNSGLLWFFRPDNWEMLVKVLDGCRGSGHFWVFAASTTNVEFTIRVTDTQTGAVKTYFNPLGRVARTITDTKAFATCP